MTCFLGLQFYYQNGEAFVNHLKIFLVRKGDVFHSRLLYSLFLFFGGFFQFSGQFFSVIKSKVLIIDNDLCHIFVLWGKISRLIYSKGRAKSYLVYPYVKHKTERVNLAVTQYFFLSVLQEDPFFKDSNVRKEECAFEFTFKFQD